MNEVVRTAAAGPYRHVLEFMDDPIVSSDVETSPFSSVFDSLATLVLGDDLLKAIAWYNNGWSYAHRVVDLLHRFEAMDRTRLGERP